jgi:hypothetical protein
MEYFRGMNGMLLALSMGSDLLKPQIYVGFFVQITTAITSPRRKIFHFITPIFAAEVHRIVILTGH